MTADYLTLDELVSRTGEKRERLLAWQRLGLVGAEQRINESSPGLCLLSADHVCSRLDASTRRIWGVADARARQTGAVNG